MSYYYSASVFYLSVQSSDLVLGLVSVSVRFVDRDLFLFVKTLGVSFGYSAAFIFLLQGVVATACVVLAMPRLDHHNSSGFWHCCVFF
jgi:hypothetical protein